MIAQTPAQSEVLAGKRVSDLDGFGRGNKNEIRRRCRIGKAIRTATSAAGKHGNRNQCGFIAIARLANWMINSAA